MFGITRTEIFDSPVLSENLTDKNLEACRDQINKLQNEILNLKMTVQQLLLVSQTILSNIKAKNTK